MPAGPPECADAPAEAGLISLPASVLWVSTALAGRVAGPLNIINAPLPDPVRAFSPMQAL
jgi:hypothetical protein